MRVGVARRVALSISLQRERERESSLYIEDGWRRTNVKANELLSFDVFNEICFVIGIGFMCNIYNTMMNTKSKTVHKKIHNSYTDSVTINYRKWFWIMSMATFLEWKCSLFFYFPSIRRNPFFFVMSREYLRIAQKKDKAVLAVCACMLVYHVVCLHGNVLSNKEICSTFRLHPQSLIAFGIVAGEKKSPLRSAF